MVKGGAWLRAQGIELHDRVNVDELLQRCKVETDDLEVEIARMEASRSGELTLDSLKTLFIRTYELERIFDLCLRSDRIGSKRVLSDKFRIAFCLAKLNGLHDRLKVEVAVSDALSVAARERGVRPAAARWARLDVVKEWAFQRRADNPPPRSRASVIKEILPELKERARAEGEPLTGDDVSVTRTVTDWFRKAKIK